MKVRAATVVTLTLVLSWAVHAHAGFYVVNLGVLSPDGSSSATGMNSSGVGVGNADLADGSTRAVRFASGSPSPVGLPPRAISSSGAAINDNGMVTGTIDLQLAPNQFVFHAFRTEADGKPTDLGTLPGAISSQGLAINAGGTVAGTSQFAGGVRRAFIGSGPGALVDLGTLPGGSSSVATAINSSGYVTGTADDAFGISRAFIGTTAGINDIGSLSGATSTFGTGINIRNEIVGYSQIGSTFHAFLSTQPGQMSDLGFLPFSSATLAFGINDLTQIVGKSGFGTSSSSAFLWTPDTGRLFDLNTLISASDQRDWILQSAVAINGSSQIIGNGLYRGELRAFRLDPIPDEPITQPPTPPLIPEPSSIVLVTIGSGVLVAWSRRRSRKPPRQAPGNSLARE